MSRGHARKSHPLLIAVLCIAVYVWYTRLLFF